MGKEFYFSDCIEILTDTYDFVLYTLVYSNELGLYLFNENEKPIREMFLVNSKLTIYYVDGEEKQLESTIKDITIDNRLFKRRTGYGIEGNLLKYDTSTALKYGLDSFEAFDYGIKAFNIRKRSL